MYAAVPKVLSSVLAVTFGCDMAKRILLVDDSISVRHLIKSLLEEHPDLEVCGEAASGAEAIKKAPELKPDLIVLDFSMPSMNGLEVAQALQPVLPATPKILFTAHKGIVPERLARSVGFNSILSKADGIHLLISEIQRLTGMNRSAATGATG